MKFIVITFCVGLVSLSIHGVFDSIEKIEILKTGKEVKSIIKQLPRTCSNKNNFCKLLYNNIEFDLPIGKKDCLTAKVGDTELVIQSIKNPNEFVFKGSANRFYIEIAACVLLFLLGIVILFKRSQIADRFQHLSKRKPS
ncbi:MAG: hypothetical protein WC716_08735 [Chitinophagaceae bacterium]|jgi:hypothetical protein